ncbi:MAG: HzsA-related protein, partial [Planctomycetota bacterium]
MAIERFGASSYRRRSRGILILLLVWLFALTGQSAKARVVLAEKGVGVLAEAGVERVVFVTRLGYKDPHWYANIGYFCDNENEKAYAGDGKPDNSKLYVLNTRRNQTEVLFDAKGGGVRDAAVHYDGKTVLFSYRPAGRDNYSLYEIRSDGTRLRRVTHGDYDDFEAAYLPTDDIVFVSTRSMRWVGCWKTQVGTLFRCDRQGGNLTPLSFNLEHDNTPAVLNDGRILYTRWEYVDRSQVGYHHLWAMNPDGTDVIAYYGNQRHYPLYIEGKAIPGSEDVLAIDSPGHGRNDHRGRVCIISAKYGPDDNRGLYHITPRHEYNDPWPIDGERFLVANRNKLLLGKLRGKPGGELVEVLRYEGGANIHEPVALVPRPREKIMADRTDQQQASGKMVVADVYHGRNMEGVKRGDIKKLLVLEALPKPVNFSGGQDLTSWLGTFMLERVLGTVPVEEDGSAYFEVPAGRPVLFVALDEDEMSVKRMQSFTNVQPGEVLSCVGCHEDRAVTPKPIKANNLMALRRPASKIESFKPLPDVIDFCKHVQSILTKNCVGCHNYRDRKGEVVLTKDLGIVWSLSYYTLIAKGQVADGRNGHGNQKPRTIGSSASRLMNKIDGSHNDVKLRADEWRTIWMWLESGAPYAGSYGALRSFAEQRRQGTAHAKFHSPVLNQTCRKCHGTGRAAPIPYHISKKEKDLHERLKRERKMAPHERFVSEDDCRFSAHVVLNASRPEFSPMLLAPMPKSAGGWGPCEHQFSGKEDIQYQAMLAAIRNGAEAM